MSNYGQQPPYGQNPYGQPPNPYGQPQQPYGAQPGQRPAQPPYGAPQSGPYGPPGQPNPPQQPYGPPPAAWTPQPEAAKKPAMVARSIPVVSMDTIPGREIDTVVGDVIGVVARTRELRPDLRGGNPLEGYVTMLTESRQDAVAAMVEMAETAGADAVVGLRFDCSEITQSLSEVAAYGTAVRFVGTPAPTEQTSAAAAGDAAPAPGQQSGGSSAWPPSSWPASSS